MYLSQLTLNPLNRQVQSELADPYQMHRTLTTRCFASQAIQAQHNTARTAADDAPDLLFRLDVDTRSTQLLLLAQSQIKPVWDGLPVGYALEVRGPKDFDPASKLSTGQTYGFRLRANPTKRLSAGHAGVKKDGPRVPLKTEQEQQDWLTRKSMIHGFKLLRAEISQKDDLHGRKDGYAMRWKSICFTGVLQVTDPAALTLAIQSGIGTAKGMGFGLLSLAPMSPVNLTGLKDQ